MVDPPKVVASPSRPARLVFLLALLLAAAALSGCTDGDTSESVAADLEGYEEAREADGLVLDPGEEAMGVEARLLAPSSSGVDEPGRQPVVLLLHDPAAGEPIEDASVSLEARMPAMGHGTGPETDPTHVRHGIYEGETTWSMPGEWILHLEVRLSEGRSLSYATEIAVGEHEGAPGHGSLEPYASFGDVMAAPGTVYEGELVSKATRTEHFDAEVSEANHERTEPLVLDGGPMEGLELRARLDPGSPLDNLNVTLVDPDGTAQAVLELDADAPEGRARLQAPASGEWRLDVAGRGLDARYEVEVEAVHHPHHVDVKLLDPADPTRTVAGERELLFAVFDAIAPEPVTEADVNLTLQAPGGSTAIEATAEPAGHGQYRVPADLGETGRWPLAISVVLPTGEAHRYDVELEVQAT